MQDAILEFSEDATDRNRQHSLFFDFVRRCGVFWLVVENAERAIPSSGADAFNALLREWNEHDHQSKLLILTRQASTFGRVHHSIGNALLQGLSEEAAVALLCARLGDAYASVLDDLVKQEAARLYYVPQALVQFAGFLVSHESTLQFDASQIARRGLLDRFDPADPEKFIGTLVREQVAMLDEDSVLLLQLVAWADVPFP